MDELWSGSGPLFTRRTQRQEENGVQMQEESSEDPDRFTFSEDEGRWVFRMGHTHGEPDDEGEAFGRFRSSLIWTGGHPARPGEAVDEMIRRFSRSEMYPEEWELIEPLVRRGLDATETTSGRHVKWLGTVLTQFVLWAHRSGFEVSDQIFRPETIDHFIAEGMSEDRSDGTRQNYQSLLKAGGRDPPWIPHISESVTQGELLLASAAVQRS